MRKLLGVLLSLFSVSVTAAINPDTLIKVTNENNPKCVEYYNYKNTMYCSTVAQDNTPIDPHIKDLERQKIVFDDRPWQAVWGKDTSEVTTIEYVPAGDNINDWHELITSQFFPGLQEKVTPKDYVDIMMNNLKQSGIHPIVNMIEVSPKQVIFEFRVESPENLKQDELQKITKTDNGLYVLHYVIKESDMGQTARDKWLKNLKNSFIAK